MTTIAQIIRDGRGRAGSNRSWRVETGIHRYGGFDLLTVELWHYSTLMLSWSGDEDGIFYVYTSTGHGSVSDQHGMNTAFKVLGLPLRYDRDWRGGGARITRLELDFEVNLGGEMRWEIRHSTVPVHANARPTPDAMRWTPQDGEDEIAEWRKILAKERR